MKDAADFQGDYRIRLFVQINPTHRIICIFVKSLQNPAGALNMLENVCFLGVFFVSYVRKSTKKEKQSIKHLLLNRFIPASFISAAEGSHSG